MQLLLFVLALIPLAATWITNVNAAGRSRGFVIGRGTPGGQRNNLRAASRRSGAIICNISPPLALGWLTTRLSMNFCAVLLIG